MHLGQRERVTGADEGPERGIAERPSPHPDRRRHGSSDRRGRGDAGASVPRSAIGSGPGLLPPCPQLAQLTTDLRHPRGAISVLVLQALRFVTELALPCDDLGPPTGQPRSGAEQGCVAHFSLRRSSA